jgi:hypothetical protein
MLALWKCCLIASILHCARSGDARSILSAVRPGLTLNRSSLFVIEKLMKLVSTRIWYGGPSELL